MVGDNSARVVSLETAAVVRVAGDSFVEAEAAVERSHHMTVHTLHQCRLL